MKALLQLKQVFLQLRNNHLAVAVRLASLDHLISRTEQLKAMLLAAVCHISYLTNKIKKVQNLYQISNCIQMMLTEMFSRGIMPLGSLSVVNSK